MLVSARVSWWAQTAETPLVPGLAAPVKSTARVFPMALWALHEWALGLADLRLGAGLGADLVWITTGPASELTVTPAAHLAVSASRQMGPGEALVELAGSTGSVETSLATLRTGGLSLWLGYRLQP